MKSLRDPNPSGLQRSSTPKTASGKDCKMCLAKSKKGSSDLCHLHCDFVVIPKTSSSPKKSPPFKSTPRRSSPTSKMIELQDLKDPRTKYSSMPKSRQNFEFEGLPQPALYKILLDITDRKKLNSLCRNSTAAAKICRMKTFQKEYEERNAMHRIFVLPTFLTSWPQGENLEYWQWLRTNSRNPWKYVPNDSWNPGLYNPKRTAVLTHISLLAHQRKDGKFSRIYVRGLFEGREVKFELYGGAGEKLRRKYPDIPIVIIKD